MSFFVISNKDTYFTGKVGEGWLSADIDEAFAYEGAGEAHRRMSGLNMTSNLHGHVFRVITRKAEPKAEKPFDRVEDAPFVAIRQTAESMWEVFRLNDKKNALATFGGKRLAVRYMRHKKQFE